MKDITTTADVELLINTFYDKVKKDDTIGYIFNEVIGRDWSHHLPVMYKFWNMVLLTIPGYEGYPTRKHVEVNKQTPLKKEHFDRWLLLWDNTIDHLFKGEIADQAKTKAQLMAILIHIKIEESANEGFIQ
jgi:hemoglobin